jgi:hypothetical protein
LEQNPTDILSEIISVGANRWQLHLDMRLGPCPPRIGPRSISSNCEVFDDGSGHLVLLESDQTRQLFDKCVA